MATRSLRLSLAHFVDSCLDSTVICTRSFLWTTYTWKKKLGDFTYMKRYINFGWLDGLNKAIKDLNNIEVNNDDNNHSIILVYFPTIIIIALCGYYNFC